MIKLHDDKKERHQSHSTYAVLDFSSSDSDIFIDASIDLRGYGRNKEDSMEDFKKAVNQIEELFEGKMIELRKELEESE